MAEDVNLPKEQDYKALTLREGEEVKPIHCSTKEHGIPNFKNCGRTFEPSRVVITGSDFFKIVSKAVHSI